MPHRGIDDQVRTDAAAARFEDWGLSTVIDENIESPVISRAEFERLHGLAALQAEQVQGPVDKHPPVVGGVSLTEEVDAGDDGDLGAALDQGVDLAVGQAVEQGDRAEVLDAHQVVAR